jgi:hypothetical protein
MQAERFFFLAIQVWNIAAFIIMLMLMPLVGACMFFRWLKSRKP